MSVEIVHPPIQITDEHDNPLRGGTMDEAQLQGLWHRVTGVMVQSPETGMYLLQQVADNPYYDGGNWTITAAGHVDHGETYLDAAMRELHEEVGLRGLRLSLRDTYKFEGSKFSAGATRTYKQHYQVFSTLAHPDIRTLRTDTKEVADVRWGSLSELQGMMMQPNPPMTGMLKRFVHMESQNGN